MLGYLYLRFVLSLFRGCVDCIETQLKKARQFSRLDAMHARILIGAAGSPRKEDYSYKRRAGRTRYRSTRRSRYPPARTHCD
jgi:hypothetical protein